MVGENKEGVASYMQEFHTALISTAALLITVSFAIYAFAGGREGFPTPMIFASGLFYLISILAGMIAHGALISAVHYGRNPFASKWVTAPAIIQWITFILGGALIVLMLYILTFSQK